MLRKRCGLSIRALAGQSGVTAGMISCVERGKHSPSLATLQKILSALGTEFRSFFGSDSAPSAGPVFAREHMGVVSDEERSYTIVFPRRKGIAVEMFDEQLLPAKRRPPFEKLQCDVCGYVLSGSLVLVIKGEEGRQRLRPGDAFYVRRGCEHRGYAAGGEPARLMTVYSPAGY